MKWAELIDSLPLCEVLEEKIYILVLVYTGSPHNLTWVQKMGKLSETMINRKEPWDNQSGIFTTKKKVKLKGLKVPQFIQSREVTAFFTLLKN